MAMIDNRAAFRPEGWIPVTGGLGVFNISSSWLQVADPTQYHRVFYLLQDVAITAPTDPASEDCKARDSCQPYLLFGGLELISPWPYASSQEQDESDLTAYLLQNAPSYQIDTWENTFDEPAPSWEEGQCRVFVAPTLESGIRDAIQICAKYDGADGRLLAGKQHTYATHKRRCRLIMYSRYQTLPPSES